MSSRTRDLTLNVIHQRIRRLAATLDLTLALEDLNHIAPVFLIAAQRMQDARRGLPGAQAYDAPTVSGSGADRLTQAERLASTPDRTQRDRDQLDQLLHDLAVATNPNATIIDPDELAKTITDKVYALRRLVDAWTPHPATDKQRRQVSDANVRATECALTRDNLNLWAKPVATSNLYGLLPDPVPVCLWVRRFARDRKRLPSPKEWQAHASQDDDLRKQLIQSVRV